MPAYRLQIVIVIGIILALAVIPLTWSGCGQQSAHLSCSVGLECGSEIFSALTHITTMTKAVANFLISSMVALSLALVWLAWWRLPQAFVAVPIAAGVRLGEQGVNSYYRRLHPHDALVEILPKIYRRHFVVLSS
ncbi:hypothetical protein COU01_02175 [Candidatus Falkowbacteria bacterium CG10_big_fil_rev_8_21_14_0_10_44_15]|uniref:Uncharacterized protein n=1 Tax=Candidatus Falkowbacteria bacterium CG10_big_fil_rev_8_21_14_0_10_44_15 TaxID=1974569 RepID=A0A2H0V1Y0_9BACT|nr:MAG: hypothetical protein COU01_02175 [Candidatus Falkowbacteria bacterium CG10_big_fil_rev_8_21_14_0_10_44_15]